jgi:hypothetical protein
MKVLKDYNVPIDKIIGICSDGASTMQGVHNGVCTQLAKYIRELRRVHISDIVALDHSRTINSFHDSRGYMICYHYYLIVNCWYYLLNCSLDMYFFFSVPFILTILNFELLLVL